MEPNKEPLFDIGRVIATKTVSERMEHDKDFEQVILENIFRHSTGDFGAIQEIDRNSNIEDLKSGVLEHGGGRILSRYHTNGVPDTIKDFKEDDIYIQTLREVDTIYTCVMYCNEY